jgi:hypothetical protein
MALILLFKPVQPLFPPPRGLPLLLVAAMVRVSHLMEIMLCTARSTDTLTVTRAQNGTSASASIAAGARVQILLQDQQFIDIHTAVNTVEAGLFNGITSSDHLTLTSATSKLVKTSVLRQDDTTNTYQRGNTVILTGWGYLTPGVSPFMNETVTFGITFTQRPIVTASYGGDTAGATSTYGSGGANVKNATCGAISITTTGFTLRGQTTDASSWAAGNTAYYQWMAIGEI